MLQASGTESRFGRLRCAIGGLAVLGYGSLTRGANVLRPGFGEDVLGPGDFLGVLGVDRDEEIARLNFAFVTLGFDLRNAQTN